MGVLNTLVFFMTSKSGQVTDAVMWLFFNLPRTTVVKCVGSCRSSIEKALIGHLHRRKREDIESLVKRIRAAKDHTDPIIDEAMNSGFVLGDFKLKTIADTEESNFRGKKNGTPNRTLTRQSTEDTIERLEKRRRITELEIENARLEINLFNRQAYSSTRPNCFTHPFPASSDQN